MTLRSHLVCRPSPRASAYWGSRPAVLVVLLAGLVFAAVFAGGPAGPSARAQAADSSIEYAENGTVPVGTFVAYDQDGDVIEWSLSGPDADRFTIGGGTLRFKEPPNYEKPNSTPGGPLAARNVYRVTIQAADGTHDVAVTVTDVDEAGTASMDRPQPQVDRPLQAKLSDEDEGVSVQGWQWARSRDRRTWTNIEGATSPRRSPEPDDTDMYLRATVAYADKFGPGKTASAVSAYRVEARTLSNAPPSFADQDDDESTSYIDVIRSVAENAVSSTPVGRPVSATDPDEDILLYKLLDTPDLRDGDDVARFTIDSLTGQIRVGKVLGADAGETQGDPGEREDEDSTSLGGSPALPAGAGAPGNSEYVLRVQVSDPSTATVTVNVIVTVTDVNEPPKFDEDVPTVLRVRENANPPAIAFGESDSPVAADTFAVTDQDADDTTFTHSVAGDDREVLRFDSGGVLGFVAGQEPNYEEKGSYSITITASSGEDERRLSATLDVTIEVVNTEDEGEVSLSQREPQVGKEVHAWVTDPDGGVSISGWMWERSNEITVDGDGNASVECRGEPGTAGVVGGWESIDGAASSVYTPEPADVDRCLRAVATYTDNIEGHGPPNHDQDVNEDGLQVLLASEKPVQASRAANAAPQFVDTSGRTSRRVDENTPAGQPIGAPVTALDDDDDLPIYTLGGADAEFFGVDRSNGQLLTKAPLNYEVRSRYAVEMIATDPSGASDRVLVTVNVTDEDDPAQITGSSSIAFAENGTTPVGIFRAFREGRGSVTWSLSGPDEDLFKISRGLLRFKEPPDYEDPQSVLAGNVYMVTIEAGGDDHDVEVTVTDVDEAGTVRIDRPQPQVERPLEASLSDDDGAAAERWQWARSPDGSAWTDIEGATSPRRSPTASDVDMFLACDGLLRRRVRSGQGGLGGDRQPGGAQDSGQCRPLVRRAGRR